MPRRHGQNAGASAFWHRAEDQKARDGKQGTVKQRLGSDSQLAFAHCGLTLSPALDPVVSPSGHVYSREAILEYLLTKTKQLKRQRARHDEAAARRQEEEEERARSRDDAALQSFEDKQAGGVAGLVARREEETQAERQDRIAKAKFIDASLDGNREDIKRTSYWVPQFQPEHLEEAPPPPPRRPPSPMTGAPLRAKDLTPIDLVQDGEDAGRSAAGARRYVCPVSRKQITTQKVVFIRSTGAYMLKEVAEELAFPTMTCPVTGKRFRSSDVLELKSEASGFAASGRVEAVTYRPTMT
mmetsp:Transcript_4827/g.16184  ORF Transcript_4827/g.16184 Transcript_4827/m.16184 type:complete len:298 (-) Transcript_4827:81-974(-)